MPNKHLFKLSAISAALLGFSSVGYAVECGVPMQVINQSNGWLNSCQLDIAATTNELHNQSALLNISNSSFQINHSNLTLSGDYGVQLIELADSEVEINNSSLKRSNILDGETLADVIAIKEGLTGKTKLSLNNVSLSSVGEGSAISVFSSSQADSQTNITIKDSKLSSNEELFGVWWTAAYQGESNIQEYMNWDIQVTNSDLQALLIASASGLAELEQEDRVTGSESLSLSASQSNLNGALVFENDDERYSTFNINLDNSNWIMPTARDDEENRLFSNGVTNLGLRNGHITLSNNNGFQTFTVYENLTGNGNFNLNTDLANEQSDKIVVKGKDSGTFTLGIQDSGNEPKNANGKVTLVETQTGQAQFSLKDRDYVDAGAYRYRLSQDGTNWILSNREGETNTQPKPVSEPEPPVEQPVVEIPVTETVEQPTVETLDPVIIIPTIPTVVETITDDTPSEQPAMAVLSEKSNALVSLRQAQGLLISQNLQGIYQRLGELRSDKTSHIWVKNINGRTNAKAQNVAVDSRSSGFEMDYSNLQIGADRAVSENMRLGGFVGTSRADVDFNGEYGKGKLRSQAVGLYGTFANENGWYWDNVAKYERLTAQSASTDKRKYNAFSLSSEIGKQVAFGNQWTLTPQAQLAYHSIRSTSDEDRLSLFSVRTGLRLAKGIELGNWTLQPYAEVNGIFENTNDAKVRVNQYQFDVPESKNRVQTAFGLIAGNGSHRLGLEFSQTHGKQVRQPFNLLANYRYQW